MYSSDRVLNFKKALYQFKYGVFLDFFIKLFSVSCNTDTIETRGAAAIINNKKLLKGDNKRSKNLISVKTRKASK